MDTFREMAKILLAALLYFGFWVLFFFIDRLVFVLYFTDKLAGSTAAEICNIFFCGLRMDLSMAAYVCALPLLIFIICLFVPAPPVLKKVLHVYTWIIIALFAIIAIVNLNIYHEWGSKISYKVVEYLVSFPKEAMASGASAPIFSSLVILTVLILTAVLFYYKIIAFARYRKLRLLQAFTCSLLLLGTTILTIRGGWQLSPMNESMAYFSDKPFLNYAAVNTDWSFLNDIIKNKLGKHGSKNPYAYFTNAEAKAIMQSLYVKPAADTTTILTTKRPNVVIIIIESFTADVIASLGGEKGITPNMERLLQEGILFTNVFAAGDRTDKGTVAVLSGFPSQAINSIIKTDSKQKRLPCIAQVLAKEGYPASFYYGGESEFVNTRSYLLSHAYTRVIDKNSFDKKDMNSKWGAYDEVVFNRQLQDINKERQPFLSTILTLTNHEPFELPATPHFGNATPPQLFKSTAWYTDSCIADYIQKAKQQPWYKNTLFVLVADHGHLLPANKYEINDYHRFRIPLLFLGGAIRPEWRGKKWDKIGGQTDIAATLLQQMDLPYTQFTWSKDLLNSNTRPFSFYDWDNGFGFATPEQVISFDNVGKNITFRRYNRPKPTDDTLVKWGKAYLQTVYDEYLAY